MGFSEDMFELGKRGDIEACHRRIDWEEPGATRQARVSIAHWRMVVLKRQGRYDGALRVVNGSRDVVYSQCGLLWDRAEILCLQRNLDGAIAALRAAPFGDEIDGFPGMAYEAIFLYCDLLKRAGKTPPPNLVAALPDDFRTRTFDGAPVSKDDLAGQSGPATTSPTR